MKFMRYTCIGLFIFFAIMAAGCAAGGFFAPKPYKDTQFLMDTVMEITAYGDNKEEAVKEAFKEIKHIHELSDNFDEHSQVSQVNQMAGQQPVKVDHELIRMIQRANELSDRLDGTFDVTIGPLTDLWGIGRKGDYVPSQEEIEQVLPLVNYHLLEVNQQENTLYLPKKGMKLDLGGIAKGYAVDRAIEILKAQGIKSALINAGGDARVSGGRPDGTPWRIGVQHPRNTEGVIAKLALTGWDNMETSGDYQRFIVSKGVRYSHILDPRTGRQPQGTISVTLVGNSSTDDDIFSTALFILGPEKGMEKIKDFPGAEAIFVDEKEKVYVTPGLEGKVEITDK